MTRSEPQNDKSLKVLVVEDEAIIAMELEGILEDLGHRVVASIANLENAMKLIDDPGFAADCAIVDANLGGRTSQPVAARLQELGIPLFVASGYSVSELARIGFSSAMIRKPYSERDIETTLASLLP